MHLTCKMGNMSMHCKINQALALLLQMGLPEIDDPKCTVTHLVFKTDKPLSFQGHVQRIVFLRESYRELKADPPVNGSLRQKWLDLMQVPLSYHPLSRQLSLDDLGVIWQLAVSQRAPLGVLFLQFTK